MKLHAFGISADTTYFQPDFSFYVGGLPQDWNQAGQSTNSSVQNQFQLMDSGVPVFDFVKAGDPIPLAPDTRLDFYAYNTGGSGSNGTVSLYVIIEMR